MHEWQLNHLAEVFVDVSAERLWAALTESADTEQYFMGSRVSVGGVGEVYRLERDDGWQVDGTVLVKEAPHRLRVSWQVRTPPEVAMPHSEVEYVIESAPARESKSRTRLTVQCYIDGPLPAPLLNASRTGWSMIMRNLEQYLDQSSSPSPDARGIANSKITRNIL